MNLQKLRAWYGSLGSETISLSREVLIYDLVPMCGDDGGEGSSD